MIRAVMGSICVVTLLMVLPLTIAHAGPAGSAEPCQSALSHSVVTKMLNLDQWQGQVVLIDFWASWCTPCRKSFPWMAGLLEKYVEQGLVIVTVNIDQDQAAADRFLEGKADGFRHVRDPEGLLAEAFGLQALPSSILIDREGTCVYQHSGFRDPEVGEYEQRIAALLEGSAPAGVETTLVAGDGGVGLGVEPWERDLLAKEVMTLDLDPLDLAFDDHVYFSKEASSGGRGFGGGGCGCN